MAKKKKSAPAAPPPGYAAILMGDNPQAVQAALSPQAQAYIRGLSSGGGGGGGGGRASAGMAGGSARGQPAPLGGQRVGTTAAHAVAPPPKPKAKAPTEQQKIASILKPTPDPKKWAAEEAKVQSMLAADQATVAATQQKNQAQIQKKFIDPEIADLEAHGIPAARAKEMATEMGLDPSSFMSRLPGGASPPSTPQATPTAAAGGGATPTAADQAALDKVAATTGGVDTSDPTQAFIAGALKDAGLPVTATNIRDLEAQAITEATSAENNPLATTYQEPGSTAFNSVGVQNFPTEAEGEAAQAATWKGSYEKALYDALATGNMTPQQFQAALVASQYEGLNPGALAANQNYAASVMSHLGETDPNFAPSDGGGGGGGGAGGGGGGGGGGTSDSVPASPSSATPTGYTAFMDPSTVEALAGIDSSFLASLGAGQAGTPSGAAASILSPDSQATLAANTSQAPGSPDQAPSAQQETAVKSGQQWQNALASLMPNIRPGYAAQGALANA